MTALADLAPRAAAGEPFSREDAERVLACQDLVSVGALAEAARRARHGNRVTYGRVAVVAPGGQAEAATATRP